MSQIKVTKEAETKPDHCQCGKPLHYTQASTWEKVERIVTMAKDPFVTVTVLGVGKFRVQRHFIALHGLPGDKVREWGFEEV